MKVGDIVRHRIDGDIGIILAMDGFCDGHNPELYDILWCMDNDWTGLHCYGEEGENLEVINESR